MKRYLNRVQIRKLWEAEHGTLLPQHRKKFHADKNMVVLEKLDRRFVEAAIHHKKLHEIRRQAAIAYQGSLKRRAKPKSVSRKVPAAETATNNSNSSSQRKAPSSRQRIEADHRWDIRKRHVDDAKRAAGLTPASGMNKEERARELRDQQTAPELHLGKALLKGPGNWFAQVPLHGYIVDFFCPQALLVVEVDGPSHQYSQSSDVTRTEHLQKQRLKVMRFTNAEVLSDVDAVRKSIRKEFHRRKNEAFNQRLIDLEWNLFRYGVPELKEKEPSKKRSQEKRAPQRKFQWYCYECPKHYFASFSRNRGKCTHNRHHRVVRICEICKIRVPGDELTCRICREARDVANRAAGMGGSGPPGTRLKSNRRGKRVNGSGSQH